jgi:hypothetical protein
MSETDDVDALEVFDHLVSAAPEAFILFLFLDVRQYNLWGKHLDQGMKATGTTQSGVGPQGQPTGGKAKPTPNCPLTNDGLQAEYIAYVGQQGLARSNALKYPDWLNANYPECVASNASSGSDKVTGGRI